MLEHVNGQDGLEGGIGEGQSDGVSYDCRPHGREIVCRVLIQEGYGPGGQESTKCPRIATNVQEWGHSGVLSRQSKDDIGDTAVALVLVELTREQPFGSKVPAGISPPSLDPEKS